MSEADDHDLVLWATSTPRVSLCPRAPLPALRPLPRDCRAADLLWVSSASSAACPCLRLAALVGRTLLLFDAAWPPPRLTLPLSAATSVDEQRELRQPTAFLLHCGATGRLHAFRAPHAAARQAWLAALRAAAAGDGRYRMGWLELRDARRRGGWVRRWAVLDGALRLYGAPPAAGARTLLPLDRLAALPLRIPREAARGPAWRLGAPLVGGGALLLAADDEQTLLRWERELARAVPRELPEGARLPAALAPHGWAEGGGGGRGTPPPRGGGAGVRLSRVLEVRAAAGWLFHPLARWRWRRVELLVPPHAFRPYCSAILRLWNETLPALLAASTDSARSSTSSSSSASSAASASSASSASSALDGAETPQPAPEAWPPPPPHGGCVDVQLLYALVSSAAPLITIEDGMSGTLLQLRLADAQARARWLCALRRLGEEAGEEAGAAQLRRHGAARRIQAWQRGRMARRAARVERKARSPPLAAERTREAPSPTRLAPQWAAAVLRPITPIKPPPRLLLCWYACSCTGFGSP